MEPDLASQAAGASGAGAPLNGTLEDNTPAGVLQLLSSQQATGAVRFSGASGCTVYLHEGELYFAETAETGEDLAVAVVRPGRLDADEWDRSTAVGYPNETVGEELIGTGSITRDLLASIVLSVIYDPLIQLFRSPEGDFEFEPGIVHWIGPFRTFSVDAIVAEVRRRTREADEMAPVIPSLDVVVRSAPTLPEDRGSVNLRRDDWEVVVAAANGRTVSDLAVELGRGRWSTARLVYRLASVGLVDVTDDASAAPAADEPGFTSDWAAPASDDTLTEESLGEPPAADSWGVADDDPVPDTEDDVAPKLSDGPPPLDLSAFSTPDEAPPAESTGTDWSAQPWDAPAPTGDDPVESAAPEQDAGDSWAEPTPGGDWSIPGAETPSETSWDQPAPDADPAPVDDLSWSTAPSADLGNDNVETTFEPPALHPDIAKALAESTYADSATAINAMAARLGAADADDDDDDWDTGAGSGEETDAFWSNESDSASSGDPAPNAFSWQPAAWETGVESTPLPQREHVPRDPDDQSGPAGSADPEWLENLYTQFMPGEGQATGKGANSVERALGADSPEAAPKAKTLRRLMSAIKRL